ncbi:MAG: NUDIX domain-containing protein [Pseudomonadota bacterium]|uniref:NUDIX domain-containing protein n=1 Tax=Thermithiobacillus tepidarius TaxID=929 RepID=UPI000408F7F9|nr:NUDIX hydrolase [Thermithiobacillus tepidarius]
MEKGPRISVDIIIEKADDPARPVLLIERHYEPHGHAIPGGFVDYGETLEHAACREAAEETGLAVQLERLLYCYSDPRRDPRGHTISAVFIASARGEAQAADDAKSVQWYAAGAWPDDLVFDHARILGDYLRFRERGELPQPGCA